MYYMKRQSNKKSVIPVAELKSKKTLISAKTVALAKKKTDISALKTEPKKVKTSVTKSKTQKIEIPAPNRKIKTADSKKKRITAPNLIKSEIPINNKAAESHSKVPAQKNAVIKNQKPADKANTEKSVKSVSPDKVSAAKSQPRNSVKKKSSENKESKQIFGLQKTERLPAENAIRKAGIVNSQTLNKKEKSVKSQLKISTEKVQPKNFEKKSKIDNARSKKVIVEKKASAIGENKTRKPSAAIENKKLDSKISKIAKVENQKIVEVHLVKKLKLPANITAPKKKRINKAKQVKSLEMKVESPILTTPEPKPKKAKAISSAVFRGAKNSYDFTVFPLDAVFENVPAIYIISRRVVDKSKKAHHALVCIGQTESLLDELKKHRKDKRAKKFAANSISLLREENENRRLKIETDLKAAHAIRCLYA